MTRSAERNHSSCPTRRQFLKTTAAIAAGSLAIARTAHAAGDETLRVGLVGCGGRGTGAAVNALNADKNAKLVAMADAFEDRLKGSRDAIQKSKGDQVAVSDDHCFVGFDACDKLLASGVDVVLLTEPPHFRPMHLKAAIDAGKHVFCEKPVAVDAPGVRSVLATTEEAKKKNLNIVSGLCWRYHPAVQETMKRIIDGAIGDILTIQETYLTGTLWQRPRQENWTEMEFQMRNWYYFTWLSGDHNTEQHVHSLDKGSWAMGDKPPVKAWGLGGRQVRTEPKFGNIYDHHAVVYEYANGTTMHSYTRQMANCWGDVTDNFAGTKGRANVLGRYAIRGATDWHYEGAGGNMYDLEHVALFNAIRKGEPINNGNYMAVSTMLAILGRMCTYTGQEITWDQAINSKEDLSPKEYSFQATPPILPDADGKYPIAMPGVTKLV
jgi:predicted dehydrogenase